MRYVSTLSTIATSAALGLAFFTLLPTHTAEACQPLPTAINGVLPESGTLVGSSPRFFVKGWMHGGGFGPDGLVFQLRDQNGEVFPLEVEEEGSHGEDTHLIVTSPAPLVDGEYTFSIDPESLVEDYYYDGLADYVGPTVVVGSPDPEPLPELDIELEWRRLTYSEPVAAHWCTGSYLQHHEISVSFDYWGFGEGEVIMLVEVTDSLDAKISTKIVPWGSWVYSPSTLEPPPRREATLRTFSPGSCVSVTLFHESGAELGQVTSCDPDRCAEREGFSIEAQDYGEDTMTDFSPVDWYGEGFDCDEAVDGPIDDEDDVIIDDDLDDPIDDEPGDDEDDVIIDDEPGDDEDVVVQDDRPGGSGWELTDDEPSLEDGGCQAAGGSSPAAPLAALLGLVMGGFVRRRGHVSR